MTPPFAQAIIRSVVAVSTACAAGSLWSQQVYQVFPRFAVAGVETRFTVIGEDMPTTTKAGLGMKHSFSKPAECTGARRHRVQTESRYYFACTMKGGSSTAKLQITQQKRKKGSVSLWTGNIQVLSGKPKVDNISLSTNEPSGQSSIACSPGKPCVIYSGEIRANQPFKLVVEGSNLPGSLQWSVGSCRSSSNWTEPSSTSKAQFSCGGVEPGTHVLTVATAPRAEGGVELMSLPLQVSNP